MYLTAHQGFTEGASLDEVFESVFTGIGTFKEGRGRIPTDIRKTESGYEIVSELPGVAKSDIQIGYEKDRLTLTIAEKKEIASEGILLKERSCHMKSRSFRLPDSDPDSIKATFENGLLTLKITKRAESQPRKISID